MKLISLLWLLATGLAPCLANEACQNMWEADYQDPNLKICDVPTKNGQKCVFPFTYNGGSYKHCITGPINDRLPACKTESGSFSECVVPTNAVIYGVTTRKAGSYSLNGASTQGGTLVWVIGTRFAPEAFTTSPSSATSNVVYLTNQFSSYSCEIFPDATTTEQITCYTPKDMVPGTYSVQVEVKGNIIPSYQYKNPSDAVITISNSHTPRIDSLTPTTGLPGTFVDIRGDFKTHCYLRDTSECADDAGARISRLYVGGQQCLLINGSSSELYHEVTRYLIKCKLDKPEVGYFRASMLVTNQYGRSLTAKKAFYVSPDEELYNFQTFAEITNVSPNVGSNEGGTKITITGKYLYTDENVPAQIDIGGQPCKVIDFKMDDLLQTKIVCESPAKTQTTNYGNRGISLITENTLTSTNDLATVTPSGSAVESTLSSASIKGHGSSSVTVWMKGFLYPRRNSTYKFSYSTNGNAKLFISTDQNSVNKQEVNNDGTVNLDENTYYYLEIVASKNGGGLDLNLNSKMLQTKLTDEESDYVANEVQEIAITSTLIPEKYSIPIEVQSTTISSDCSSSENSTISSVCTSAMSNTTNQDLPTVQQAIIKTLGGGAPFSLGYFDAETIFISYGASAKEVQDALNDIPYFYPNKVQVTEELANDGVSKNYTITFSADLGVVQKLSEKTGFVNASIDVIQTPLSSGAKSYLVVDNKPSGLFDINSDSTDEIKSAISESFGIRCPVSIQMNNDSDSKATYDYESCSWNNKQLKSTAFCGKCANTNNLLFSNLNASLTFQYLCLAYKLESRAPYMSIQIVDPLWKTLSTLTFGIETIADNNWHYDCFNLKEQWEAKNPTSSFKANNIDVYSASFYPPSANMFTDVVSVRKTQPLGFNKNENLMKLSTRRVFPSIQYKSGTLQVSKSSSAVEFQFRPTNCTSNLPLILLKNGKSLTRVSAASPAITGTFDLAWNNNNLNNIASNISAEELSTLLQSIQGFGNAQVTRVGDCSGYKWTVKWLSGGDKPSITIPGNNLNGNNVNIAANGVTDGGASFNPITDDIMRTYHTTQQVSVMINNIPTKCADCSFVYDAAATPTVSNIDATDLTNIQIAGSGFGNKSEDNIVLIGDVPCTILASTTTSISCKAGNNSIGTYPISLNVLGKGKAVIQTPKNAVFSLNAERVNPNKGSTGGGNKLEIFGTGFSQKSTVTVDGNPCPVVTASYSLIVCTVPQSNTSSNKVVDVIVSELSSSSTISSAYTYDFDNTPEITSVLPSVLRVSGGEVIVASGTNLPILSSGVKLEDREISIISSNNTHLVLRSPPASPGEYKLNIIIPNVGRIRVTTSVLYKLYISSISPKIGSIRGGTQVNVYGDGFDSNNCQNNLVSFGSQSCEISNCTSNHIKCQTSTAFVTHEITNDGSDPYHGKGYAWNKPFLTINIGDSVRWSWMPPTGISTVKYQVIQVADALSYDPTGFTTSSSSARGSYTYEFNQAGTYHYWSGYVESSRQITFRGIINVVSSSDKLLEANVKLNGFMAQKCVFPFEYNNNNYTSCTNVDSSFQWCSPNGVYNGQKIKCDPIEVYNDASNCNGNDIDTVSCGKTNDEMNNLNRYEMLFTTCSSGTTLPTITSVSRNESSFDDDIIISGSGFRNTACQQKVMIGKHECTVTAASSTELTCRIGPNSGLYSNYPYNLEVLVSNLGYALKSQNHMMKFLPKVNQLSPNIGSVAGGTKILINGDGFLPSSTVVFIGNVPYYNGNNAYITGNTIEINTLPSFESSHKIRVTVNNIDAVYMCPMQYNYSTLATPLLNSVSPSNIASASTVTLNGEGFGSNNSEVVVKIGKENCVVTNLNSNQITCDVTGIAAGNQLVTVSILGKGRAKTSQDHFITGKLNITSISPNSGSIYGGQLVTISGNGFDENTRVSFGSYPCIVQNASASLLKCKTTDSSKQPQSTPAPPTTIKSTTTTTAIITSEAVDQCLSQFQAAMLKAHNAKRALHQNTGSLAINNEINKVAQKYAEYLANNRLFKHSSGSGYGENLAKSWSSNDLGPNTDCGAIGTSHTKLWYDEIQYYDYNNPGQKKSGSENEMIGHFTQVVWNNTVEIGCGIAKGTDNFVYSVCNYSPFGNIIGAQNYQNNVLPLANRRRRRSVNNIGQVINLNSYSQLFSSSDIVFTYSTSATPEITSINPENGNGGAITIAGSGFGNDQSLVHVTIGKAHCNITSITNTQIVCNLAENSAGSHEVKVHKTDVGYSNMNILYTYSLTISSLSNNEGSIGGGLDLVISGSGFSSNTNVKICDQTCKYKENTFNSYTCIVPPSAVKNADSTCTITLKENGLSATGSFTYKVSLTPTLTSVSPSRGGTGGGTLLTITGNGFPNNENLVNVTIAGSPCVISSISSTQIQCRTEPYKYSSIISNVDVSINGNGLALNDGTVKFEYIDLWSSRFTWGGLSPPGEGEIAVISSGQHIYFDAASTPVLKGIIIQGGSLIFDDNQDVALNVEYVIIIGGGKFQVGTEEKPFQHKAVITMHGHVRSIELPTYGAKVIALRNGTLDLHGKPVGVTWTKLGSTVSAGNNQITLQEPVIWPIGSEIIVASTGDKFSPGESELAFITGKSSDNTTLTLNRNLEFEHLGEDRTVGSNGDFQTVSLRAEVGLLTRNVKFQGWNDKSWNRLKTTEGCPKGFNPAEFATQTCFLGRYGPELGSDEFGGIIFIFAGQNQPKNVETVVARLSNTEFYHVGQAFKKGRYPIHFHMNGDMRSSFVKECAIHESFNRAINIHASNYLKLTRNVIYNIMGGAYFLEDGVEIGNEFKYNLAVFVRTSSSLLNEDVTPAAFWATNANNTYLHNAVAGSTHFGWWYRILDHPEGPSYRTDYCPKKIPFGRHFNNSVHSTGRFGLWIFPGYMPTVSGNCNDYRPSVARFDTFTTWNNDKGAEFVNSNNIQFVKFTVYDQHDTGIDVKIIKGNKAKNSYYKNTFNDESLGPMISDSVIIGNSIQGQNSIGGRGFTWAWDRGELLKNTKFYNYPTATAMDVTSIDGTCGFKCGGWHNHVKGLTFNNVKYKHNFRAQWDNVLIDLDGSLTGKAGDIVVYKDEMTQDDSRCRDTGDFKNGIVCSDMQTQVRFAFNNFVPSAAMRFNVTNSLGKMIASEKLKKRLTHKFGFMFNVEAKQEYTMFFDNAERPTNMSYSGAVYNLLPGDYIIVKHPLKKKPDQLQISNQLSDQSDYPLTYADNKNGDWYWDNSTFTVHYIVKNENTKPFLDVNLAFSVIKCRYVGCKPPESPGYRAPISGRPDNAIKFSEYVWGKSSFLDDTGNRRRRSAANGKPEDGDSIIIPDGVYMILDAPLPKLNILKIDGYLELDNSVNHYLEAEMIFINGGELIIGWENDPITTNVSIVLTGEKSSLNFRLPNGLEKIGGKGIGVYGGLTIHGKPRVNSWTKLASTASAGSNELKLIEAVDWVVGDEIVITTTSFVLEHTETIFISAVSDDRKTITLTKSLVYDHLAYQESFPDGSQYIIAAAVGLLTRNVKVIGQEYPLQQSDLYGFRIVVGDYSAIVNDFPTYYKGFVRLSNVEFVRAGQFDRSDGEDSKYGVLLSNLGAYNQSRPTYIRNCAFHHGLGVAVGVFSSSGMKIENNVIHKTLDYGIRLEGNENEVKNNLVAMNQWGSTYLTGEADLDKTYWGAIDATKADSAIIVDNFIAGAERAGLNYRGDLCDGDSLPKGLAHRISGNTIYGAGAGVVIETLWHFSSQNCLKISGFTVYKSQYYAIYYQGNPELVVENNILVDNKLAVFTIIHGPAPQSHIVTKKQLITKSMLIVGSSLLRDCDKDVYPKNISDSKQIFNTFGSGSENNGRGGLVFPTFIIKSNGQPDKPWTGIMSYNQLGGHMLISNITFANFNTTCGHQDATILTSIKNDDGQHPITMSNMRLFNVESSSKVWYHRPNVRKINPSDCVDMDCDGLKKNLITDTDGSFLGSPGAVISQSEFEWGINGPRGLGDFRIPSIMLAYPNGSLMNSKELYDLPGIVRDEQNCTYQSSWQAYECHGLRYKMLIIESMDSDTEDRRLSPVAILSHGRTRYLDLINGPQDHGWCFGYTCQKRVSAFMALVAADTSYDIVLTSTPPETLRMRILNSDSSFKVRLSMTYSVSQRIDVYKDSNFVNPSNAYFVQGKMQLRPPTPKSQYLPEYYNASGSNVFIKEDMKIYFATDGATVIDLKIAPVLFVSFGLPAITPEEFFNEATIVGNFAKLLGVEASKIRRVEIVRASRRRRDTNSLNYVKIIIEENASSNLDDKAAVEQQKKAFDALDAKIGNLFVTNQLQENAKSLLNVTIASLAIQKPASNTTAKAVAKEANIKVVNQASGCSAQIPCSTQPSIKIIDENGDLVDNIGNDEFPWIVVANLTSSSNPNTKLLFETEAKVVNGYANFTKLGVSEISTFTISYKFKTPEGINNSKFDPKELETPAVKSDLPVLSCQQYGNEVTAAANGLYNMTINIIDKKSKVKVDNISWANYVWKAKVQLHELGYHKAPGKLSIQNASVTFDPVTGLAEFNNLAISSDGMYVLLFSVLTTNNEYSFSCFSKYIQVTSKTVTYDSTQAPNYVLKYEGDINSINEAEVTANVYNYMLGYNVSVAGVSVTSGSVYITFYSNDGSNALINSLVTAGLSVDPNLVFSYASINDYIINCTNCVIVTTTETTTTTTADNENIIAIAVGAIVGGIFGGLAGVFMIFIAILGFKEYNKIKVKKTTVSPNGTMEASKPKTRIDRLLENLMGTTEQNYSSGAPKTPNMYDRSYLDKHYEDPMPVIPNAQKYNDLNSRSESAHSQYFRNFKE